MPSHRPPSLLLLATALLVGPSCTLAGASGTPATPHTDVEPSASEPAPSTAGSQTHRDMLRHDELAEKSRAAIVAGDLDAFRLGMEIAAVQPLPGELAEHASTFVERARAGAKVSDLDQAAKALGQVGAACADCHAARPKDRYPASGFEEGDAAISERMQRHWWATDALWQGLVTPSDGAWKVGATTLADRSLVRVPGFPKTEAAKTRAEALQAAARTAMAAEGSQARGAAFGQIVGTCADCHTALKQGPVTRP